jgi:hypothetical protein
MEEEEKTTKTYDLKEIVKKSKSEMNMLDEQKKEQKNIIKLKGILQKKKSFSKYDENPISKENEEEKLMKMFESNQFLNKMVKDEDRSSNDSGKSSPRSPRSPRSPSTPKTEFLKTEKKTIFEKKKTKNFSGDESTEKKLSSSSESYISNSFASLQTPPKEDYEFSIKIENKNQTIVVKEIKEEIEIFEKKEINYLDENYYKENKTFNFLIIGEKGSGKNTM